MGKIDKQEIYRRTNGGLDIILHYYPQASKCVGNNRPFSIREEDSTPSAFIKSFNGVYYVTDFGNDSKGKDCISVCMEEENLEFYPALKLLASRYGIIEDEEIEKKNIRYRDPEPNELENTFEYEKKDHITKQECEIWGTSVKEEHLKALNWYAVKWIRRTDKDEKNNRLYTTIIESSDNYPVFVREIQENFIMIYQPKSQSKAGRFRKAGVQPADLINGLDELKIALKKYNDVEEADFNADPANENKTYKPKKFDTVILCSGERDSMNCLARGYHPVWLNSETANFKPSMYHEIMKCCHELINIPDIDATGIKQARIKAFNYIGMKTVLLPDSLKKITDERGNPCKDLTDYCRHFPTKDDFKGLLNSAMPIRFWDIQTFVDNTGNIQTKESINTAYFLFFLQMSGFGRYKDPYSKEERLVFVENYKVKEVTAKDIRGYAIQWLKERNEPINVLNLLLNSNRTKGATMDDLPLIEINFSHADDSRQFFFFNNTAVEITAEETKLHDVKDGCDRYVWEQNCSKINFKRSKEKSFTPRFDTAKNMWEILINPNCKSLYMRYLINSSRTYWREELEQRSSGDPVKDYEYSQLYQFSIAGERLSVDERFEQMQNLASKMFSLGYLLHRHKAQEKTWFLWVMEDKISEDGESSGGSGKSFMIKFLENLRSIVFLGGRNRNLTDNQFIYQNVSESTDVVWIDDANQHMDVQFFYEAITANMTINKKHVGSSILPFDKSPKFVFTSNFPPKSKESSTLRRMQFVVFSDYYHQQTDENGYRETRRIFDDFNMELGGAKYTNEQWNEDINFLIDCVQFYLLVSRSFIKIEPPMDKVRDRYSIQVMGNPFKEWAEVYFNPNSPNCNNIILYEEAFQAFQATTNIHSWTPTKFGKALKEFCSQCSWITELNPIDLCNTKDRRIIKHIQVATGKTAPKVCIYVRTENKPINRATSFPTYRET